MKCPICGSEIYHSKCSRFPICHYICHDTANKTEQLSKYIVFDIETTGFSKTKDRIIEIGAIKVSEGKIIDEYSTLSNPGKDDMGNQIFISARITQITGITNQMVKNSPEESEVVRDFLEWVNDYDIWVGQNVKSFDIPFMKEAAKRADRKIQCKYFIDTLLSAKEMKLKEKGLVINYQQLTLAKYFGFEYNAHRALDDVKACYRILKGLEEDGKNYGVEVRPILIRS